jgi:thioredoxin 2
MSTAQLIRCPNCGANNRVSLDKVEDGYVPRCGRCKSPLQVDSGGPFDVTDATFADQVERSGVPVLVDFWAAWCGPCRMMPPILHELAGQMGGRVRIAKLNVDENPRTAQRFGISSIPALMLFKDGQVVENLVGVRQADELARVVSRHV